MSLQSTFWHKGQRDTIGSRVVFVAPVLTAGTSTTGSFDSSTFDYTIASTNGRVYASGALDELDVSANMLASSHENNPTLTVTDDSATTSRIERQSIAAVSVPASSYAKAILTIDASQNVRGYIGEIVTSNLASAKFPVLDLDDEAPFWAMELTGVFTFGTTAWGNAANDGYAIVGMP